VSNFSGSYVPLLDFNVPSNVNPLCVCVCVALVHSEAQAKTQMLLTGGPAVSGRQEQQVNPLSAWNILVAAKPIVLSSFVCGRFASR
jgi:hypothetical protein